MLYQFTLYLHSWLRWAIVVAGAVLLVRTATGMMRGRAWQTLDQRVGIVFLSCLDAQVLIGFVLYFFLSPITPKSLSALQAAMPVTLLRFFAVEHATGMLGAAIAWHVGWARGKRAATDRIRHRRVLVGLVVALLAIAISIPWPWLPYGRPLVRP